MNLMNIGGLVTAEYSVFTLTGNFFFTGGKELKFSQ